MVLPYFNGSGYLNDGASFIAFYSPPPSLNIVKKLHGIHFLHISEAAEFRKLLLMSKAYFRQMNPFLLRQMMLVVPRLFCRPRSGVNYIIDPCSMCALIFSISAVDSLFGISTRKHLTLSRHFPPNIHCC